jgi:acyl carrier protein
MTYEDLASLMSRLFQLPPEVIGPASSLTDDLGLDSFALLELVLAVEELVGADATEAAFAPGGTVGDLMERLVT